MKTSLDDDEIFVLSALRRDRERKLPTLDAQDIVNFAVTSQFKAELWLLDFIERLQPGATTSTMTLEDNMLQDAERYGWHIKPERISEIVREVQGRDA